MNVNARDVRAPRYALVAIAVAVTACSSRVDEYVADFRSKVDSLLAEDAS